MNCSIEPHNDPHSSFYLNNLPEYTRIADYGISNLCNTEPPPPELAIPCQKYFTLNNSPISSATFLPEPLNLVISISSEIQIHDIIAGNLLHSFELNNYLTGGKKANLNAVCGVFTEPGNPLFIIGMETGDFQLYDIRSKLKNPTLAVKGAHSGPISGVCAGIPYNSNYIFTSGLHDGWIKEFDLRFPYNKNYAENLACPMQSLCTNNYLDFYRGDNYNHQRPLNGNENGILSMQLSPDGNILATSSKKGGCDLHRLTDIPLRRIKQWILDDQSVFHDIKFTQNSQHLLISSVNESKNLYSAHLWDTINSNNSVCLKTPGDGAILYQHHFYLQERVKTNQNQDLKVPKTINSEIKSNNHVKNLDMIQNRHHQLILHTPESPYLENIHKEFWEKLNCKKGLHNKSLFSGISAQHAAFYMDCGLTHPSYGRTDAYDQRFFCHPWRNLVIGIGGNKLYNGIHVWDSSSGICLSTSSFYETQFSEIRCINGRNKSGVFVTGHSADIPFENSSIILWNLTNLDYLLDISIGNENIDLIVD